MSHPLRGSTAIVGIGATEFSKESGRSEMQLAVEAVTAALDDAGLTPHDVDGLTSFTMDSNLEIEIARLTGMGDLTFFSRIGYGGGAACGSVQQAAMAIVSGIADVVVVYRAFNERSGERFGLGVANRAVSYGSDRTHYSWSTPYGLSTPAQYVALFAQRYLYEYNATSADFGRVSVLARKHAATNPKAWYYGKPITLEDHQNSRVISDPLRLYDCCQETDGGQALVLVSAKRAKDLKQKPAYVIGAAQGIGDNQQLMTSYYRPSITGIPEMGLVGQQLYSQADLRPSDMDAAIIYDHFTPLVLPQLEELGFCGRGEAKDFIAAGMLELDGIMPTNTHGGQIGEAYLHGVNGIAEGVRLVRGESVNQPPKDIHHVMVTAGTGVPTSGLILAAE